MKQGGSAPHLSTLREKIIRETKYRNGTLNKGRDTINGKKHSRTMDTTDLCFAMEEFHHNKIYIITKLLYTIWAKRGSEK